jgi:hypothetical protein
MKKTPILFVLGAVALLVASCATAPKPAPEPAAPLPEAEYQKAKDLRSTIGKYSLDKYDAAAFQKAEASFKEGEAAYGKDNAKAKTALDQAVTGYRQVLDKGFSSLTGERQSQADKAKAEADALKAAVAMKSEYAAALDVYNQARKVTALRHVGVRKSELIATPMPS